MTDEDLLRGRLRSAASEMPVGSGSLTGVQARAAQLQRRRSAVRGGVGAFALVAVALVGVVSLRDGGLDELTDSVVAAEQQEAAEPMSATTAAVAFSVAEEEMAEEEMADDEMADDEMAAEAGIEPAAEAATSDDAAPLDASTLREIPQSGTTAPLDSEELEQETALAADDAADESLPAAAFAAAVTAVSPPPGAGAADVRYFLSEGRARARVSDAWFVHDGTQWHAAEPPDASMPEADEGGRGGPKPSVLHETTLLGVATSVEVSGGVAWLKHGERVWEICPIPHVDQAHSMIAWMGEHVAIVVGIPEQSLYLLERID